MKKIILIGILSSLTTILIFLNSSFGNLDRPLVNDPDLFYSYFILQHQLERITHLDFKNFYDTRMFYPHQNTLAYGGTMFTPAIITLPFYLFGNFFISVNLAFLIICFLNFLSMYILAYYLTRSISGSILAGIIYTYNPWIVGFLPGNPDVISLFWIPLIFLISEKILEKITWLRILLVTGLFLCQLLSFFYYFMFLLIIWPVYIALRLKMGKYDLKNLLHPAGVVAIIFFLLVGFLYSQPYLKVRQQYNFFRSIEYNIYHSARPIDFVLTGPQSRFYSWMVNNTSSENSLFMGWSVYLLLIVATIVAIKNKIVKVWFAIFCLSILFAFGPYLQLGSLNIPLPYLLFYKLIPLANAMRVPARFIMLAFLSASILVAYTFLYFSKFKRKNLIFVLIIAVVVLEYQFIGPTGYSISQDTQNFYQKLDRQKDVKVILELPMANDLLSYPPFWRDFKEDSIYLLYGLYHHKYLVNGYSSFTPPETVNLSKSLAINFPTPAKLEALKNLGVNMLIIHKNFYQDKSTGQKIIDLLDKMNVQRVYQSEDIVAFLMV